MGQEIIALPPVKRGKGKDVLSGLKQRKTIREVGDKKIPLQLLSNLLWAACGVNRKKGPFGLPGRTAASASNSQEIDVYVVFKQGIFLYDPFKHRLIPVCEGDLRPLSINKAQEELYAAIRRDGGTQNMLARMQTRAELYATIGYHDYEALDKSIVTTVVPQGMPQNAA